MGTRQYIGARYVPKFYENSSNTSEWQAGVMYEPLTIVTYNGNSYTSKKSVPSNVGNPSANPTYWAATGIYSTQVELLRQQVEQISSDTNNLLQNVKGSYILIGDSFSVGLTTNDGITYSLVGGWADRCKVAMEAAGYDVYINTRSMSGNTGFASSLPFVNLLQAIKEDHVTTPAEITDIVVIGGTNDIGHETGIEAGIRDFCQYAHNNFPNAKIKIGTIGTNIARLHSTIVNNYKTVSKYGGTYIGDLTNLFCDPALICYDGVHLTEAGYEYYWGTILDAVITGHAKYTLTIVSPLTLNDTLFTGNNSFSLYTTFTQNGFSMSIDSNSRNVPISLLGAPTDLDLPVLFNISNAPHFPTEYNKFAMSAIIAVYTSDKKANYSAPFWLYCAGDKIYMYNTSPQFFETSANYCYFHVNRETTTLTTN